MTTLSWDCPSDCWYIPRTVSTRNQPPAAATSFTGNGLLRVANARLLIKFKGIDSTANVDRLVALFEAKGVDRSRLMLEGYTPHAELLARYNDVDIALDPFPYSGGLTTYEALWMGVPVITVPGETFASRHSLSHLSTLGLPELVAHDRDDYVKLAVGLANDTARLAGLRAELRGKMSSSPICNGGKFAEGFAMLMRDIWRNWCLSHGGDRQRAPSSPDGHGHPTT